MTMVRRTTMVLFPWNRLNVLSVSVMLDLLSLLAAAQSLFA
jgi:hypothetical protein